MRETGGGKEGLPPEVNRYWEMFFHVSDKNQWTNEIDELKR